MKHFAEPSPQGGSPTGARQGNTAAFLLLLSVLSPPFGPVEAGTPPRHTDLISPQKHLDSAWVRTLFERGTPSVFRGKELTFVGMPVGGLCAGQLYLGGDGTLWLWDIFNRHTRGVAGKGTSGENYVKPLSPFSPLDQGFALQVRTKDRTLLLRLDRSGFRDISFRGQYPVAEVTYRDPACPVTVHLQAFSPFIPLNFEDSSLPATCLTFHVKNTSAEEVACALCGWLENATCLYRSRTGAVSRRNTVMRHPDMTLVFSEAMEPKKVAKETPRPDIVFEDFERPTYDTWTSTGTAFGEGPIAQAAMPRYQGKVGCHGKRLVNSHNTRHGEDVRAGDAHTGTLTSKAFTISRHYIRFLIGGGAHAGKTCLNLVVEGKVVRSATGKNDNRLSVAFLDVRPFEGKKARLVIVDNHRGGWGNIGVDYIVFTDAPPEAERPLREESDWGTLALALLQPCPGDHAKANVKDPVPVSETFQQSGPVSVTAPPGTALRGSLARSWTLPGGREGTATFVIAWHFPNLRLPGFKDRIPGRSYATKFSSARAVASYLSKNWDHLSRDTLLWRDTFYGGTLPCWFLQRTFINTSILATSTVFRFAGGRFWGWEGVGCCHGTCTHVWHYAQAVARLFPSLERYLREKVDFGLAFDPKTGMIRYRGEFSRGPAVDGQAGCVLRAYREHLTSSDTQFLRRNWKHIKKATLYLINKWDPNHDGILEGAQPNTLDAAWYGKIPHLTSMYLAALRASEAMAGVVGDTAFADRCRALRTEGSKRMVEELFNGEYFVQIIDPKHKDAIGTGNGCHIDQVLGQSWAFQVGVGRILPEEPVRSALRSLWKYNFTLDVGPYKAVYKRGRPYAVAGEGGLLMCTWPRDDRPSEWEKHWQFMYFNECMTGFEYQVAAHMIFEGMVKEGLAVVRAIHERYLPRRRNPYNEIECSDHYARAMASYGVFLAACGFQYDGPRGYLAFGPRIRPERFEAAFTAAEGWGVLRQVRELRLQRNEIEVRWGSLRLRSCAFQCEEGRSVTAVSAQAAGRPLEVSFKQQGNRVEVTFAEEVHLGRGDRLTVVLR